ncbi:MAG: SDR family NAD(P)-dependent oxidoreductase [Leptolinea sp.]|jgi:NADP-dependent 3-hydroxy acid dehydrogenase YdfG|nr:SDR family NAD(P)-dependent oxidoreductase [Leptolinea sp.]
MTERLDGTVALVTGASSGIGEAAARQLAAQGASVALAARRKDRLEKLAAEITAAGGNALVLTADIGKQAEALSVVEKTVGKFGRLDTLVNNAGLMLLGNIENASTEEWERMIDINLKGVLYTSHAAIPHLLKAAANSPRKVADLVNISSVAGRRARVGAGVYNATKFGVVAITESLRQEVTSRHVRISVVEPGVVATELTTHMKPEVAEINMKPFAGITALEPEDIADIITFIVTRPWRSAINEVLVRPTEQAF